MKHQITVHAGNRTDILCSEKKENLLSLLSGNGYIVSAPCGGNGKCGKCKVTAKGDFLPPYGQIPSPREIQACKAYPCGSCSVFLDLQELRADKQVELSHCENLGISFDVGTTSVSATLLDLDKKCVLSSLTCKNTQASFGADIITRLSGDYKKLSDVLIAQINSITKALCPDMHRIKKLTFAANTVISHYLAGLSPEGLAAFPLRPADTFGKTYSAKELGFVAELSDVYIFPSLAPFVGGDITSGLLSLNLPSCDTTTLLIDIGTNGEMVLCKNGISYVTSAAAGPAFEGGELSCGMPAEPGAVVAFDGVSFSTINGLSPRGIAGSGAIDILSLLVSRGVIEKSGRLLPPDESPHFKDRLKIFDGDVIFSISDDVFLSAMDVRKLQLAKAAIRAALSLLLIRSETSLAQIDCVYIAGSFGASVNVNNAATIGLIPRELLPVCCPAGNTSLMGAQKALFDESSLSDIQSIVSNSTHIELSNDAEFEDEFLKNINM